MASVDEFWVLLSISVDQMCTLHIPILLLWSCNRVNGEVQSQPRVYETILRGGGGIIKFHPQSAYGPCSVWLSLILITATTQLSCLYLEVWSFLKLLTRYCYVPVFNKIAAASPSKYIQLYLLINTAFFWHKHTLSTSNFTSNPAQAYTRGPFISRISICNPCTGEIPTAPV